MLEELEGLDRLLAQVVVTPASLATLQPLVVVAAVEAVELALAQPQVDPVVALDTQPKPVPLVPLAKVARVAQEM